MKEPFAAPHAAALQAPPRSAVAYRAIKDAILSHRLAPGDSLPIERFVRELGLSRTPLREAIQQLEKEGFVEVRPRMGSFVSQLSLREIQEMYQVRLVLEGFAARLAAERVDRRELLGVEAALRRHAPEGVVDHAAMSEDGQLLHRLIIDGCGNHHLAEMLRSLQDHFSRFRVLSLDIPEKIVASHREHLAILDALLVGDGERAEARVREHFENASRALIESLVRRGERSVGRDVVLGARL